MNAGDTGFMLICTAFVFFMTPGLAFFYGGLVRRKNVVNTMMACGAIMGLSVVMWTLFGYSLAFGGNHGGIIGDFRWFALNGVGWEPGPYADTIPHLVFVAFQMMYWLIWTYPSMERMHIRHSMDLTDKSPFLVNVNAGVKEKINM